MGLRSTSMMNDDEFEGLPLQERRRIVDLIKEDPTKSDEDLEPKPPQETELQRKSRELMDKDWELIPHRLQEIGLTREDNTEHSGPLPPNG